MAAIEGRWQTKAACYEKRQPNKLQVQLCGAISSEFPTLELPLTTGTLRNCPHQSQPQVETLVVATLSPAAQERLQEVSYFGGCR
ncbi:hypothetical protein ACLKA7_002048 [Drosophila subpalustris]